MLEPAYRQGRRIVENYASFSLAVHSQISTYHSVKKLIQTIKNIWSIEELRSKIIVTLTFILFIVLVRILFYLVLTLINFKTSTVTKQWYAWVYLILLQEVHFHMLHFCVRCHALHLCFHLSCN